jgi:hypothetical protein
VPALALVTFALAAGGCKTSSSNTASDHGGTTHYDIKTMTCSEVMSVDADRRGTFERAELKVMADAEGLTVTDDLANRFVVNLHEICDSAPTDLWAADASAAFTNAVTSP